MYQKEQAITVSNVSKSFKVGKQTVPVLKDISFEIATGDFVVIFGPSGCGKSTLLHVLLGLEAPTQGKVNVVGRNLYALSEDQLADFRKHTVGMVYQQPHWIKALNVIENVAFPLTLLRIDEKSRLKKAQELLEMVKMTDWAQYYPSELSSGQQQRISLARALISDPRIIVADEPTGNLDFDSGVQLMKLLQGINQQTGKTILMVTHDLEYMKYASSAIKMLDGQVVEIVKNGEMEKLKTETDKHAKRGAGHGENSSDNAENKFVSHGKIIQSKEITS